MVEPTPQERLSYDGDLAPVLSRVAKVFGLDAPENFSFIKTGYEDCNILVEFGDERFVVKMFSKKRTPEQIDRYVGIIRGAVDGGVRHPKLHSTKAGDVYRDEEAGVTLALFDYVPGRTFFEQDRAPDESELEKVIEQAAVINSLDLQPSRLFDSWAVQNISDGYEKVRLYLSKADRSLVEQVIQQFEEVPLSELPQAFVHGDLTKANILLAEDGDVYVLDFSVANRYPRIQELAVMCANLTYQTEGPSLAERTQSLANLYSARNPLTDDERTYLYPYALAAVAMEFVGSNQEKFINGDTGSETDYWLKLGRDGLHQALTN